VNKLFQLDTGIEGDISQQVLSIRIGEKHCCFAITDKSGDILHKLVYYSAKHTDEEALRDLFLSHEELNGTFIHVFVCYDHPQSLLVPISHFRYEDAGSLLRCMYGILPGTIIVSESITDWQLHNIYGVPGEMHNLINRKFSRASYWHQYSLEMENLKTSGPGGCLQVDIRKDDFSLLAGRSGNLLIAQTFKYSTPEDILYFLLKTCNQFDLSQQQTELVLSGLVDQQSALYKELYLYFIHIQFREAGWTIRDSEYPAHFFTSLNDLARCAS